MQSETQVRIVPPLAAGVLPRTPALYSPISREEVFLETHLPFLFFAQIRRAREHKEESIEAATLTFSEPLNRTR
jgi:hypothetical protein